MVIDELIEQVIPHLVHPPCLGAHHPFDEVQLHQHREVVLQIEPPQQRRVGLDELPEELVAQVDGGACGGRLVDLGHDQTHLLLPRMAVGPHLPVAEEIFLTWRQCSPYGQKAASVEP
ncbi:hypothetical protein U9M48_018273 [Paspalum notatum var. saurae]|uniref:Uncharacterized protein n=1 Tax=Paspalum notatum var. saurae TaxID=547442 RepID=A0AAQ3TB52_PASNO